MNDEQFELTISDLAGSGTYYADIADELRARDTAQREAVEAWKAAQAREAAALAQAWEQRDAAQAQLARVQAELPDLHANMTKALDLLEVLTWTKYTDGSFVEAVDEADEMLEQLRGKVVLEGLAEQREARGAQAGEFWAWLDLAYRDGSKGEGRNFTKYNMEVAYRAGAESARQAQGAQAGIELVGYANFDQLDNMLDDRTATLHPKKTGFAGTPVYRARAALATQPAVGVPLTVWYGSMPESNGKTNWTAILHRKGDGLFDGPHLTIARSEYPDRVRYEADQVRHIIGELAEEPDILAYDADAHSGYIAPPAAAHRDSFRTWLAAEMPAGTVIGNPAWWAERILKRIGAAAHGDEALTQALARVQELEALINTPHTDEWFEAVRLEAAHQVERWGAGHDAGKAPADWFWLLGYLGQKAMTAAMAGDESKARHHTISSAAMLLNWFRAIVGDGNAMRPGIDAAMRSQAGEGGE